MMKRALRLPAHFKILPSREVSLQGIERMNVAAGVPLYLVSGGNEPVFKLELLFRAGKLFEENHNAASATAAQMTEGTVKMASPVVAEALEYYGATVRCYASPDTLTLSVHAMTRFAGPVFDLVHDILLQPAFSTEDLQLYQKKKIQRYKIGQSQNEYLANRIFSERIFGNTHPYGYTSTPEDVMALSPEILHTHHRTLGSSCLDVFLAGDTRDGLIEKVRALLRDLPPGQLKQPPPYRPVQTTGKFHAAGPQPHQTSVRIGKEIISRRHRDYPGLFLLNTIIGGYHGSRLIRNLREDKGLTYNVYSSLESLLESTCFVVTTDANPELRAQVVSEIYQEIETLRSQTVGRKEMEMVKNYICGNFLMQIDGPFNVVDTIKPLILHRLPVTYFEEFITQLRSVSAKKVKSLAENYLNPQEMVEVVVG